MSYRAEQHKDITNMHRLFSTLSVLCVLLTNHVSFALPLKVGPSGWVDTGLTGATFISDIAVLGNSVYAGGLETIFISPFYLPAGQLWLLTPSGWTGQYATPLYYSKVSSLIANTNQTLLYSSVGNVAIAGVDSFTPSATAPVALDDIANAVEASSTIDDLSIGPNNVLYAAGGTTDFPPYGEVWAWDGTDWNATNFSDEGQGTAIWLTYAPPNLYVAANTYDGSEFVVYAYNHSTWQSTQLPVNQMNLLQALNVDSHNNLYAVGASSNSGTSRGSLLVYKNNVWQALPVPSDSEQLNVLAFSSASPKDFIFAGGLNTKGQGAVWYGTPCPSAQYCWFNTQLTGSSNITALSFFGNVLYAGGTSTSPSIATIWSLVF